MWVSFDPGMEESEPVVEFLRNQDGLFRMIAFLMEIRPDLYRPWGTK